MFRVWRAPLPPDIEGRGGVVCRKEEGGKRGREEKRREEGEKEGRKGEQ